jgi:hypothetical protein
VCGEMPLREEWVGSGCIGSVWRDAVERGVERGDGTNGEVSWRWRFREVGEVEYEAEG